MNGPVEMLENFTLRDLQTARAVLLQAASGGLRTGPEIMRLIEARVGRKQRMVSVAGKSRKSYCPACGSAALIMKIDGLDILACRDCRYSGVVS